MSDSHQNRENPTAPRNSVALSYQEAVDHIRWIRDPETEEDFQIYYLDLVDSTFPGANVSDLIFSPDIWFRDDEMLHAEFSDEELAEYLMAWTGKRLAGAEAIDLPVIPDSKSGDSTAVIAL